MTSRQCQGENSVAAIGGRCSCERCGAPCKVAPVPGSKATWLKAADKPKGLCVDCAVHDILRHLYPANLQLAQSAGRTLLHPQIQKMFFDMAAMHGADARLEEINWTAIVANWDLPFPTKLKQAAASRSIGMELHKDKPRRA